MHRLMNWPVKADQIRNVEFYLKLLIELLFMLALAISNYDKI